MVQPTVITNPVESAAVPDKQMKTGEQSSQPKVEAEKPAEPKPRTLEEKEAMD